MNNTIMLRQDHEEELDQRLSTTEKCFYTLLLYFFGGNEIINLIIVAIRRIVLLPDGIDRIIAYVFVIIIGLIGAQNAFHKSTKMGMWIVFFFLLSILISWILSNDNDDIYIHIISQYLYGVIAFFFYQNISNFKRFYNFLTHLSLCISTSIIIQIILAGMGGKYSYNQYYAYALLPAAIISTNEVFRNRKVIHLINLFISLLLIFSMGARWPLICVAIYILVKIFFSTTSIAKKTIWMILILSFGVLIYLYINDILNALTIWFNNAGLSLRTVNLIKTANFFEDRDRNRIWSFALGQIDINFLLGVGIGKDRVLVSSFMGRPHEAIGFYPHNIFLEILMQFGGILGTLIILFMSFLFIKSFKSAVKIQKLTDCHESVDTLLMLMCTGFLPLLVSASYINWLPFFMLLGFSMNVCRTANDL